jgi:hypothetical protein
MQLGTLINHLSLECDAATALEALGDIVLFDEVHTIGERYGETPGEYVANAARRFAALGSDEDWQRLMTAMERSSNLAKTAFERMLRWALEADAVKGPPPSQAGCTCGSYFKHEH